MSEPLLFRIMYVSRTRHRMSKAVNSALRAHARYPDLSLVVTESPVLALRLALSAHAAAAL